MDLTDSSPGQEAAKRGNYCSDKASSGERPRTGFVATVASCFCAWPYTSALVIFVLSRCVVAGAIFCKDFVVPARQGPHIWQMGEAWYHDILRWDAGWYIRIAEQGYGLPASPAEQSSIVFFPLLPLLAKALSGVTSLRVFDSLLIIANAAAVACVPLLIALVKPLYGPGVALRTVALLSFFPTSFFLSSAYTESLTLMLALLAFLSLERGNHLTAAMAAGLAAASRPTGVALVPAILTHLVLVSTRCNASTIAKAAAVGALGLSGLAAYAFWQWGSFGDPFAFVRGQAAWAGTDLGLGTRFLRAITLEPVLRPWFGGLCLIAAVGVIAAQSRKLPSYFIVYAGLCLAIPYALLATGSVGTTPMPRFVLIIFPVFTAAALLLKGRPLLTLGLLALSTAGLFLTTAHFAQWYWIG
ncbi:MAG: hypothetical protein QOD74_1384 [Variibacter sp.]|nr:hypothetical protein [Variibacter sp.]